MSKQNLTVKQLKDALTELDLPDDFQIRMGVNVEACDYITEVGAKLKAGEKR